MTDDAGGTSYRTSRLRSGRVHGHYKDGGAGRTTLDLTACKSWATVTHRLENAGAYEDVDFALPFALTSPTPTYDIGIGNGIYGKLPQECRLAHRLRQPASCPVVGHDRRTPGLCGNGDRPRISGATLVPFD